MPVRMSTCHFYTKQSTTIEAMPPTLLDGIGVAMHAAQATIQIRGDFEAARDIEPVGVGAGHTYMSVLLDMCMDMRMDMCIDICVFTLLDMCIDMCIQMCTGVPAPVGSIELACGGGPCE